MDFLEFDGIEHRVFEDAWSREELAAVLPGINGINTWVVELNSHIVGYLMAQEGADVVHLLNLAIDLPWQHRGLGKKLLNFYLDTLPKDSEVNLEVKRSNWPAIHLYINEGFTESNILPRYYADGEDALVLKKEIC